MYPKSLPTSHIYHCRLGRVKLRQWGAIIFFRFASIFFFASDYCKCNQKEVSNRSFNSSPVFAASFGFYSWTSQKLNLIREKIPCSNRVYGFSHLAFWNLRRIRKEVERWIMSLYRIWRFHASCYSRSLYWSMLLKIKNSLQFEAC